MDSNNYTFVSKLLVIDYKIRQVYVNLCELECNNLKKSQIYIDEITKLKNLIKEENAIYNNKKFKTLDYIKCYKIVDSLLNEEKITDDQEIVLTRILSKISSKINEDYKNNNEELIYFYESETDMPIKCAKRDSYSIKMIKNKVLMNNALELDYLKAILMFSTDFYCGEFKNDVIGMKYNFSLITEDIEKEMLENQFNLEENVYFYSKLVADLLNISNKEYLTNKISYGLLRFDDSMLDMLDISNEDYNNKDNVLEFISNNCCLRAALSLLDEDSIRFLKSNIDKSNISTATSSFRFVKQIVDDCKKDKQRCTSISLARKKY